MKPYHVQENATSVEAWTGYRVQFDGQERHPWQKAMKAELKQALDRVAKPDETFRRDSKEEWSQLSGELFTVRRR